MTALRGTPPPTTPGMVVSDETAPTVAAAILAGFQVDPQVAALCRWIMSADVAGLRRELAGARAETALAREDFHRMRALCADRPLPPVGDPNYSNSDTLDDDLSDAVPLLLEDDDEDEETPVRQVATLRIQCPTPRPARRPVSATDG